jgi:hypothetical protein
MQPVPAQQCRVNVVASTRKSFTDANFVRAHCAHDKAFTRKRKLPFSLIMLLLLQKTVRSIQLHLHDFFEQWTGLPKVTASAWTQARAKLRHTAFIELNERVILPHVYDPQSDFGVRRWRGHRLLAIDSSCVALPSVPEIGQAFGWRRCHNQSGACGQQVQGRLSVLFDVQNRIALDAQLVPWKEGERAAARRHFSGVAAEDVLLLDRGFAGYEFWAALQRAGRHFVCRCARQTFGEVRKLFAHDVAGISEVVTVCPPRRPAGQEASAPLRVRLVTVRLSSGELEVLATSLLDPIAYPTEDFAEVYRQRWGIETYYELLKGRLALEHFSGRTVEAIRQDVHATIFVSNLETVMTRPVQAQLHQQGTQRQHQHGSQVNRAVSFHASNSHALELLLGDKPIEEVLREMDVLFSSNPVSVRRGRRVPRHPPSAWRSYRFQRHTHKPTF